MLKLKKRVETYHVIGTTPQERDAGLHGTLSTRNREAANQVVRRLEIAISEGADSKLWSELRKLLPIETFTRFSKYVGVKERLLPTWTDLRSLYEAHMKRRVSMNKFSPDTETRYKHTLKEFELFLSEQSITLLQDISKPIVEKFKVWRSDRSKQHKQANGGGGLALDAAILHAAFNYAVENEMVIKNPVKMEGKPGENPEGGAEPYTAEEVSKMREHADADRLAFLLLRRTGLRGSDAVKLTWSEVDFKNKEIWRLTQKRKKRVFVPIHTELLFALEVEYEQRKPKLSDVVLLHPETKKPLTRPVLYNRIKALGERAGVANAHPHRFRDTLALDMLLAGASPYDVAKILGDTIEMIEQHYTPFVPELRERVRSILESGNGLENRTTAEQDGTLMGQRISKAH